MHRCGGVLDDEMLMALPPDMLDQAIAGMEALSKNGLRYPFPHYGIQQDVRLDMAARYQVKRSQVADGLSGRRTGGVPSP